jgi:hypothetical protein
MPSPSHSSGGKVQPHLFSISATDAEYKELKGYQIKKLKKQKKME